MNIEAQRNDCEVAVIGAGPYGLSVAAHLRDAGIETRVFGEPMSFWRDHMPSGMKLRSEWHATHLSDPQRRSTLDVFGAEHDFAKTYPLPLQDFMRYGLWFQQRHVPELDRRKVIAIHPAIRGFRLTLADGDLVHVARVVVALGLQNQDFRPAEFRGQPASLVSHSCDHVDLSSFKGLRVGVIGRGQSATEIRGAAGGGRRRGRIDQSRPGPLDRLGNRERGAARRLEVEVAQGADAALRRRAVSAELDRRSAGRDPSPAGGSARPRQHPQSAAGGSGVAKTARGQAFASMPAASFAASLRTAAASRCSSTTACAPLITSCSRPAIISISRASAYCRRISLARVTRANGSPVLRAGLELNVAGLHFVGASAVASFGPIMRFVAGVDYAAHAVARAVRRDRRPVLLDA